jgi:hypothetical protein
VTDFDDSPSRVAEVDKETAILGTDTQEGSSRDGAKERQGFEGIHRLLQSLAGRRLVIGVEELSEEK